MSDRVSVKVGQRKRTAKARTAGGDHKLQSERIYDKDNQN